MTFLPLVGNLLIRYLPTLDVKPLPADDRCGPMAFLHADGEVHQTGGCVVCLLPAGRVLGLISTEAGKISEEQGFFIFSTDGQSHHGAAQRVKILSK